MTAQPDGPAPRGRAYGSFMTLGLQLAIGIVAFVFLGRWLDGKFGTDPWLMLTGLVLGAAGGLTAFIKQALDLGKQVDREAEERKKEAGSESER